MNRKIRNNARWLVVLAVLLPSLALAQSIQIIDNYRAIRVQSQLLTNAVATGNGQWIDIAGISQFSVSIRGITTATVEVDVSNDLTQPLNTDHGITLGAALTADGLIVAGPMPVRWAKCRVTAYTSGTINCILQGQP